MQHISSIYADCDKDTLIVEVVKEGPACHTGAESCFFEPVYQNEEITPFSYEGLYDLIMGRKTNPKEGSLHAGNDIKILFLCVEVELL